MFEPDGTLGNADWTKQGWDLPARDLKSLRAYLEAEGDDGRGVQAALGLPAERRQAEVAQGL